MDLSVNEGMTQSLQCFKPYTYATEQCGNGLSCNAERWHAAAAPYLPERPGRLTISAARTDVILLIRRIVRPFRAWPSGNLLEFLQLRSFDRSTSVSSSFPRAHDP